MPHCRNLGRVPVLTVVGSLVQGSGHGRSVGWEVDIVWNDILPSFMVLLIL